MLTFLMFHCGWPRPINFSACSVFFIALIPNIALFFNFTTHSDEGEKLRLKEDHRAALILNGWTVLTQKTQSSFPKALHPNPNSNCLPNTKVKGFRVWKPSENVSLSAISMAFFSVFVCFQWFTLFIVVFFLKLNQSKCIFCFKCNAKEDAKPKGNYHLTLHYMLI